LRDARRGARRRRADALITTSETRLDTLTARLRLHGATADFRPYHRHTIPVLDTDTDTDTDTGDFIARSLHFSDSAALPEIRIHDTTLGTLRREVPEGPRSYAHRDVWKSYLIELPDNIASHS